MKNLVFAAALVFALALIFPVQTMAQTARRKIVSQATKKQSVKNQTAAKSPAVTRIDALALKKLVERGAAKSKPLLVNFWATWCDPCRDEFPELVKINGDYKDKLDYALVSLDDLAEIKRDVPKFLTDMKAEAMPAYLLKTQNEEAAISSVSKDYAGGLPFTILFDGKGAVIYSRRGKFDAAILRGEIDKVLTNAAVKSAASE